MALGMPLAAVAAVGQSVLQALRMAVYVTWISFLARFASLIVLVALLTGGMGITAAFIARIVFEGLMAACFTLRLRRESAWPEKLMTATQVLKRSLPFAIGRLITEGSLRAALLCVSAILAMSQVGLFDSADRVGLAFQAIAAAGVVALIPVFSRSVETADPGASELIGHALKYTSLLVSAGAYVIAALAQPLVVALYGKGFDSAAQLLPTLLLAQALTSGDAVLRQALLAHGREYALIGTGAVALAFKAAITASLAFAFGLEGAAVGVLLSTACGFAGDLWLAQRARIGLDIGRFVLAPLACVAAAFLTLAVVPQTPVVTFMLGVLAFGIAAAILRVFPADERRFLLQIVQNGLRRRGTATQI
jgi:O-antigen/teichoic acid export membrane protein